MLPISKVVGKADPESARFANGATDHPEARRSAILLHTRLVIFFLQQILCEDGEVQTRPKQVADADVAIDQAMRIYLHERIKIVRCCVAALVIIAATDGQHHVIPERREGIASVQRSEEHTYELESLMRISYAVFCLK